MHGLNPLSHDDHAERTWTHADGTFWPKDLLPLHIPSARVMLFAYNANVAWDTSEAGIRQHANALLDLLDSKRVVRASGRLCLFLAQVDRTFRVPNPSFSYATV